MSKRCPLAWLCLLLSLFLLGCQHERLHDLVDALNARQISHCLFLQGSFPPYGSGYLYAKSGELPCEEIWRARRILEGP